MLFCTNYEACKLYIMFKIHVLLSLQEKKFFKGFELYQSFLRTSGFSTWGFKRKFAVVEYLCLFDTFIFTTVDYT